MGYVSLWWWPGVTIASIALIESIPHWGWWLAVAVTATSLLAEYAHSGWRPNSLVVPMMIMIALATLAVSLATVLASR